MSKNISNSTNLYLRTCILYRQQTTEMLNSTDLYLKICTLYRQQTTEILNSTDLYLRTFTGSKLQKQHMHKLCTDGS